MSYQLQNDQMMPGFKVLMKDNKPLSCPFQQPVVVQGKLAGQVSLQFRNCGTWCALFESHEVGVILNCTAKHSAFPITPADKTTELTKM